MNTTLHAAGMTEGRPGMAGHLQASVQHALARFGERVTRVDAHLSDENGPARAGSDHIRCLFEVQLVGQEPVIVNAHAATPQRAVDAALRKLGRAVGKAIAMHDPRRHGHRARLSEEDGAERPGLTARAGRADGACRNDRTDGTEIVDRAAHHAGP